MGSDNFNSVKEVKLKLISSLAYLILDTNKSTEPRDLMSKFLIIAVDVIYFTVTKLEIFNCSRTPPIIYFEDNSIPQQIQPRITTV